MTHLFQRIHRTLHTFFTHKLIGDQGDYTHCTELNRNIRFGENYVLSLLLVRCIWLLVQKNGTKIIRTNFFDRIQIADLLIMVCS